MNQFSDHGFQDMSCTAILPCFVQLQSTPSLFALALTFQNEMPHHYVNALINSGTASASYKIGEYQLISLRLELKWDRKSKL